MFHSPHHISCRALHSLNLGEKKLPECFLGPRLAWVVGLFFLLELISLSYRKKEKEKADGVCNGPTQEIRESPNTSPLPSPPSPLLLLAKEPVWPSQGNCKPPGARNNSMRVFKFWEALAIVLTQGKSITNLCGFDASLNQA